MKGPFGMTQDKYKEAVAILDRQKVPSAGTAPEPEQIKVVDAGATGSLPVSETVFRELNEMADFYEEEGNERTADTIRRVSEIYMQHMGLPIPRQPEENQ